MPTATPFVPPDVNFSARGLAAGVPDVGFSEKWEYGGFNVKVTDVGDPDRACDTVTVFEVVATAVVPPAIDDPVTVIPIVTPLVSLKCRTQSDWPSMVVAAELVGSVNVNAGACVGSPVSDLPTNDTTVPTGTLLARVSFSLTSCGVTSMTCRAEPELGATTGSLDVVTSELNT
jgi:hypothetical protein